MLHVVASIIECVMDILMLPAHEALLGNFETVPVRQLFRRDPSSHISRLEDTVFVMMDLLVSENICAYSLSIIYSIKPIRLLFNCL